MKLRPVICTVLLLFVFSACLYARDKKGGAAKAGQDKQKKSRVIDLEALDIQGLIDRPQTLYILKKSKINFYDTVEETDYVKTIVESTYKAPF